MSPAMPLAPPPQRVTEVLRQPTLLRQHAPGGAGSSGSPRGGADARALAPRSSGAGSLGGGMGKPSSGIAAGIAGASAAQSGSLAGAAAGTADARSAGGAGSTETKHAADGRDAAAGSGGSGSQDGGQFPQFCPRLLARLEADVARCCEADNLYSPRSDAVRHVTGEVVPT